MSIYLDASVIVALFAADHFSGQADSLLRSSNQGVIVSDFAAAEFASSIARRVRMKEIPSNEANLIFSAFDAWLVQYVHVTETQPADIALATAYLRRLDLTLRTGDSVNIAIARRMNASLATFDVRMGECARALGIQVFAAP